MPSYNYTTSDLRRFWAKVVKTATCWQWIAFNDNCGYGKFQMQHPKFSMRAHRLVYEITYGDIPPGALICHHCDNPACVNPQHLYLGTYQSNLDDARQRGHYRPARGIEKGRTVKLTDEIVRQMRQLYATGNLTQREIAATFGVHRTIASRVIRRAIWAHVQ